ncbi:MAG: energy transducer TonB [Pyrinomonadaceae bacterium]
MFNNLVESSSHRTELRRRGSFFLFTTASYALLFVIVGVVSIYAYDARLEDQSLELVPTMRLVDLPLSPEPIAINRTPGNTPPNPGKNQPYFERKSATADVDRPEVAPDKISTGPNVELPMPKEGIVRFTGSDVNPTGFDGCGGSGSLGAGKTGIGNPVVRIVDPPPAPIERPAPKLIRKKIINSEAIELPKPIYPAIARQMGTQGAVNVQVLIDEKGRVISAKALSGSPMLSHEAVRAAYQARFSPTLLDDQPVKVSGIITYNFVLQR